MRCSNCGHRMQVVETRHDDKEHITYRERQCPYCFVRIYTKEEQVNVDIDFLRKWDDISRWKTRKK